MGSYEIRETVERVERAKKNPAERTRWGQMLQQTERAIGARAGGKKHSSRGHYTQPRDSEPTLSSLGLTKRDGVEAQALATMPVQTFCDEREPDSQARPDHDNEETL